MKLKNIGLIFISLIILLSGCTSTEKTVKGLYVSQYRMTEEEERGFMLAGGKGTSLLYQLMTPKAGETLTINIWKLNEEGNWEKLREVSHKSSTLRPVVVLRNDLKDVVYGVFFTNSDNYELEDSVYIDEKMPIEGPYERRIPIYITEGEEMEYNKEYSLVINLYTNDADPELENIDIKFLYYNPDRIPQDKVKEAYLWTISVNE
ncbi:MAG: hypothetical protein GX219_09085 [Tissierellia bacterium]|nr:hypothetical protein [Tissierellia bacterium]